MYLMGADVPDAGIYAGVVVLIAACAKFAVDIVKATRKNGTPTRREVAHLIEKEAPYSRDKKAVWQAIDQQRENLTTLAGIVQEQTTQIAVTTTHVKNIEQKVDRNAEKLDRVLEATGGGRAPR